MSNESNFAGKQGAANPYQTQEQFKQGGMSDTQAAEAYAAAQRVQQQSGSKQ